LASGQASFLRRSSGSRLLVSHNIECSYSDTDQADGLIVSVQLDDTPAYAFAADVEAKGVAHLFVSFGSQDSGRTEQVEATTLLGRNEKNIEISDNKKQRYLVQE